MLRLMLLALMPLPAALTNPPTPFPTAAPTRIVVGSITITNGAIKQDYDDVTEVTTSIIIEDTDLTSLAGWFPNLVLVTGNLQITNNAALTTMNASFPLLETVSGYLDIFGNGALVELGSALPFPGGLGLVTGYVSIYNNPVLPSLGSALEGLVTISGYCSVYNNLALTTLDTAFDDLVTVTGYLSIYANPELASLGAAFSNLVTVTGTTSVANNPSLLCALDVGSRVVFQTGTCQLTAAPTGPPTTSPASSSPSTAPSTSTPTLTGETFSPTAAPTTSGPTTPPSSAPMSAPSSSPISLDDIEERIENATGTLATVLDSLVAGLNDSALDLPETLDFGSDYIAVYFEDVQAVFALAGPGQDISGVVGSAFTAAGNLASNFTLEIALQLNTDYDSCQGNSASGITLTAIHVTADAERVSFPVFPKGFTGATTCMGDSPMPLCLNASTRASSSGGADKMSLPPPLAVSGTSAYVSFVVLPTSNTFITSGVEGVASKVISATVLGVSHNTAFRGGATMTFELAVNPVAGIEPSTACAWWDEERQRWSNAGCTHIGRSSDGTVVECRCNHLTSFAILTDASSSDLAEDEMLTEMEHHSLSVFVYVCVSISIACLLIVIAVYATVRSLRSQTKTILLNLCSIYALALVLFMASALGDFEGGVCVGIGASLHFALLSTFFWMLVEGRHLYMTFVNVFEEYRSDEWRQLKLYSGVAYGIPAFEVLVVVCGWPSAYTRDDGFCFLSKHDGAIWAFFGTALVVIVLNIYVLVMVSRVVWDLAPMSSDSKTDKIIYKAKRAFKSSMVFGSILGVTWVIGLLSLVVPTSLAYHYSFAVFNALGGVWIFGFHLLMDPEVGAAYRDLMMARRASVRRKGTVKVTRRRDSMNRKGSAKGTRRRDRLGGLNLGLGPSSSVAIERMPQEVRRQNTFCHPFGFDSTSSEAASSSSEGPSTPSAMRRLTAVSLSISMASDGSNPEQTVTPLTNDARASGTITSQVVSITPVTPETPAMLATRRQDGTETAKNDGVGQEEGDAKEEERAEDRRRRDIEGRPRRDTLWDLMNNTVWDLTLTDTSDGQRQAGTPETPDLLTMRRRDGTEAAKNNGVGQQEGKERRPKRNTSPDPMDKSDAQRQDQPRGGAPQDPVTPNQQEEEDRLKRQTLWARELPAPQVYPNGSYSPSQAIPDHQTDKPDRQDIDRPPGVAPQDPDPVGGSTELDTSGSCAYPLFAAVAVVALAPGNQHSESESSGTGAPEMRRETPAYVKAPGYLKASLHQDPTQQLKTTAVSGEPLSIAMKPPPGT